MRYEKLPDGTIVYQDVTSEPPVPHGYRRKGEGGDDRYVFIPLTKRQKAIAAEQDEGPKTMPLHVLKKYLPSPRFLPDGTIAYPRKGFEPPPPILHPGPSAVQAPQTGRVCGAELHRGSHQGQMSPVRPYCQAQTMSRL